jgi:hypothetical protein
LWGLKRRNASSRSKLEIEIRGDRTFVPAEFCAEIIGERQLRQSASMSSVSDAT